MSLRDQLLKKGLVSKSDVRRSNQNQKMERKKKQGSKQRKRALRLEREAAEAEVHDAKQAQRASDRTSAMKRQDAHEQALRVRNLILGHRIRNRGDQPFWFRMPGKEIRRMQVHRRIAEELAVGNLAIAMLDQGNRIEAVLIGGAGAAKLAELRPEVLLHWAKLLERDDGDGILQRSWETSLSPHRVRSS